MAMLGTELSEYERKRQENIAKNQALLRTLALEASSTGLAPLSAPSKSNHSASASSRRRQSARSSAGTNGTNDDGAFGKRERVSRRAKEGRKNYKLADEFTPRRTSSRLRGIVADSEVAKRKAEEEHAALAQAERAKRQRVSGDVKLGDVVVGGGGALRGWDGIGGLAGIVGPARPYERTYEAGAAAKGTTDKELRALREKMGGLSLWEGFAPNRIKITPERIYSLGFHPTQEKPLVFAGDKLGNLGVCDCSQTSSSSSTIKPDPDDVDDASTKPRTIKNESDSNSNNIDEEDFEEEEEEEAEPAITTFKIHTRTISAFKFAPTDSNSLYSASYDSSIRKLDLQKGVSTEIWAPADAAEDEPVTAIDVAAAEPHTIYFTTISGQFGIHDVRAPASSSSPSLRVSKNGDENGMGGGGSTRELLTLSDKKIGGFSLHPHRPHLLATASLDRMLKLWDLRKIGGRDEWRLPTLLGEHESRLSVSHASFNAAGQVATASYDDTVKIYDFGGVARERVGESLSEERMKPRVVVPHNNQTGRWVTILRAQWQEQPSDSIVQRFCIGNMNRFVDVYTSDGDQIAQLGGEGITAVPAVARFHPSMDWVAGGTASGKLCLWM